MISNGPRKADSEAFWHEFLTRGHSKERTIRHVFRLLPHDPRCRLCAAPFEGGGAPLMRLIGKRASQWNPNYCNSCFKFMERNRGGAEIECALLFADVRGSTALAEELTAAEFKRLLNRFYETAIPIVFGHDGVVDKFVGDELVAIFFPLFAGRRYAAQAIEAARALLAATGHADPVGPWLPIGAGVHTGIAWVGSVGTDTHAEFTALGDTVNTTARLASAAGSGQIFLTAEAAEAADLEHADPPIRLDLKGKQDAAKVFTLVVRPPADPSG